MVQRLIPGRTVKIKSLSWIAVIIRLLIFTILNIKYLLRIYILKRTKSVGYFKSKYDKTFPKYADIGISSR